MRNTIARLCAVVVFIIIAGIPQTAQLATGNVAGSVRDAQGGVIPGATVVLISATRGTSTEVQANANGDFVFANVTGDRYTLRVTMDGFKALERPNVAVSPGDRLAVGTLTIEVGTLAETVTVTGEAPMIQAQSGERSFTVTTEAVANLPVANRNFAGLAALTPGVIAQSGTAIAGGVQRLGGGGQNNIMMDGVSTMDTGNNGQMLQINVEAIAEVRVLTQGYQAEYGRSSGLQISAVTKAGTNQFRASVYDIERNSDWNANSWANAKNGDPKAVSKQRDWGYSIGGPVGKPGGTNKLFFFYAHEYRPRSAGGTVSRFRVPTALERAGDFSQTRDNNGALFNLIRDASTGLPCAAADTRGCFRDAGVLGKIPQNRLYGVGQNILNLWPLPNVDGLNYNYETTVPVTNSITTQPVVRMDYTASNKLRLTGKFAAQTQTRFVNVGSLPGFNDGQNWFPNRYGASATVDYTLSDTAFIEGTWGWVQNQLTTLSVNPPANRFNVGLGDLPMLYPDAGRIDPSYYAYEILEVSQSPMWVDGNVLLPPQFQWGNRIANTPPNISFPGALNVNRTHDVSLSMTKLMGRHTAKAGFYWNHAYKAQNLNTAGAVPFQGALNFGNDTLNPLDSGFGFANAALGIFSSYAQQSRFVEGGYIYNNIEWYIQDNWRVNSKFTLDYGVRFVHLQPTYDTRLQSSNFFPDQWTLAQAPLLYVAGCAGASPCSGTNRQARDPRTGQLLGPASAVAIGQLVPASGNLTNGIVQAGQGISKYNYTWPSIVVAPRFGFAYDISGRQSFIIRGGIGLFHDRPAGDTMYSQVGNPPFSTATTVRYATLQALSAGLTTQGPPQLTSIWPYESNIPASTQWNAGVQMSLPWNSSLDVSYVGQHGINRITELRGQTQVDINAPDFGAAFLPQNQDPTLAPNATPGANAFSTDLLRPYRGLGQVGLNRRFSNGMAFGLNYVLGLATTGTTSLQNETVAQVRLQHAADGSYTIRDDQREYEELNKNMGNRRHLIKSNFVWDLPDLSASSAATKAIGLLANDWQLSGVLSAGSGAAYDITYAYQNGGSNVNLTGSPSYPAKIVITGDPGKGCTDDQYGQFTTSAFSGPKTGSLGLESGRNYMTGCPDHTLDLAIARNIRLGGARQIQLRVDLFNALNSTVFSNRVTQLQLNSPTDPTVRNSQYRADGTIDPARLTPRNAGFGAVTAAQAMRSMQLQIRFQF
jgi:hypothetical protein